MGRSVVPAGVSVTETSESLFDHDTVMAAFTGEVKPLEL